MKSTNIISLLFISYYHQISGFAPTNVAGRLQVRQQSQSPSFSTKTDEETKVTVVDNVISDMHESEYPFRIVVVGNGAILETTSKLGPVMKSSVSPKTGGRLVTLASEDQSFEFHVKVDEVEKVAFIESVRPVEDGEDKVLRICRFMNGEGGSICSLILGAAGGDAVEWFDGMKTKYA